MPHLILKMYAGRTDEQKVVIADALTAALVHAAGSSKTSISVAIEDVAPEDWMEKVFEPDIAGRPGTIIKKPGYGPRE
jgi:4-oxalocrotonate tautomerase